MYKALDIRVNTEVVILSAYWLTKVLFVLGAIWQGCAHQGLCSS